MLARIQWEALLSACRDLGVTDLEAISSSPCTEAADPNEDDLKKIHHVLFEIHVIEGTLICPESGRRFPVKDGIPNMLLHEDEVGSVA